MKGFKTLLFALLLCSCAPLVRADQPAQTEWIQLESGSSIGQTFVARYAGFSGFEVFLEPEEAAVGPLILRLFDGPQAGNELASGELSLHQSSLKGYYRIPLSPQTDSTGKDYFASLEMSVGGPVLVGSGPGDAYLNGALYQDQEAQDAQLAFRLVYDPWLAGLGLSQEGLGWIGRMAIAGFLFVLPGWALLAWLLPGWRTLSWGEKLGLGTGASLAIYPLLFLWTYLAGLHPGPAYAWGPPLFGLGALVFLRTRTGPPLRLLTARDFGRLLARLRRTRPADLALLLLAALIFATRFWVIRNLDIPLWGDSYQHTLITQLLVDRGGLFSSWQPYAELQTFTYHFGFHTLAAVFRWITGLPSSQAVLWVGQILNSLAVLALYPLGVRFGRSRWAGVVAVLVAGLLVQMPMFYVNWGRYTELAGLAILPAAVFIADQLLAGSNKEVIRFDQKTSNPQPKEKAIRGKKPGNPGNGENRWAGFARSDLFKTLVLAWVLLAGLALTHYRVLVFAGLFLPAALLLQLRPGKARLAILQTLVIGAGAGLLFLPWFIRLLSGRILQVLGGLVTTPARQVAESVAQYNTIGDLTAYLPGMIWVFLFAALAWGTWRRERGVTVVAIWWLLVLLAANPHWLGLPGAGALSNFAVFIAAYVPAGILIGAATGWAQEGIAGLGWKRTPARNNGRETGEEVRGNKPYPKKARRLPATAQKSKIRQPPARWVALLLILLIGVWGARQRVKDISVAQHALATRPDLRAAAWIQANTPQSARFLVNSFPAYGDTLVAGSDGGWWLPFLAQRETTLPPINYSSEQGPRPDYLDWTNALTFSLQENGLDDPQAIELLKERGVSHIYIGQQHGRVGNQGRPLLQAGPLSENPHFQTVYHQDRVWIFEILE